jgi:hypothetical protein
MKLCAFFHERKNRRKPPIDNTKYGDPLSEDALPRDWVADFLMPPFRDADTQDAMQMEMGALDEGPAALITTNTDDVANQFWCDPAAYWDSNACGEDVLGMGSIFAGACGDVSIENMEQHALPVLTAMSRMRLQSKKLTQYSDEWRLPSSPLKLERGGDLTPRTESGDSGPDDNSTSASDLLGIHSDRKNRSSRRHNGELGVVGRTAGSNGESSSANSSPWMIPSSQEPSWGPFGGAFDGLHSSLLTNSTLWDPSEPVKVPEVS